MTLGLNDIQHNKICHYCECHDAEYLYVEGRYFESIKAIKTLETLIITDVKSTAFYSFLIFHIKKLIIFSKKQ